MYSIASNVLFTLNEWFLMPYIANGSHRMSWKRTAQLMIVTFNPTAEVHRSKLNAQKQPPRSNRNTFQGLTSSIQPTSFPYQSLTIGMSNMVITRAFTQVMEKRVKSQARAEHAAIACFVPPPHLSFSTTPNRSP
ncbi:hypothetical protein QCA50_006821 [Cerrena zonata]|uniref:Uncharacterized protein n=1 Tax=Cerrena zonata TaxID=2478898 RepID=A0AAW0G9Z6_9APHY